MASVPAMFLLFFLVFEAIRAQQNHSSFIGLGSSLSPTTPPTSWPSPSGLFSFGFYPQGNGFAVGIWLAGQPNKTVVWTANRDDPPVSSNATLDFTKDGKKLLLIERGQERSFVNLTEAAISASMLDSGNFVFYGNNFSVIWQSFSFPTDTILGGQNLSLGSELVSSVSTSNHSTGRFVLRMQEDGNLVAYHLNFLGDYSYWSTGTASSPYNQNLNLPLYYFLIKFDRVVGLDLNHNGLLYMRSSSGSNRLTVANITSYTGKNKTIIYRATFDADGIFRLYAHSFDILGNSTVFLEWSSLQHQCQVNGFCGFNSFCSGNGTKAVCRCFPGFLFVNHDMKFLGCYRSFRDEEICKREELPSFYGVKSLNNISVGSIPYSVVSMNNKDDCGNFCKHDCYCGASLYFNGTCSKTKLPLIYGRQNKSEYSATGFFKVSTQIGVVNLPNLSDELKVHIESKKKLILILAVSLGSITLLFSLFAIFSFLLYKHRFRRYKRLFENSNLGLTKEFTLRPFSYNELEKATDGFKEELGRGSFGAVYMGCISEANKIVAVKRLEKIVEEGEREFQAEMTSIGQTHHRNLVRLLGFCMEGSRRLLVYEYMSNGSLAHILFNVERRPIWRERVRIAMDIARGILYLHEECEAHIVHFDIKPQNILLDDSWIAKITDFGLAKLLIPNQCLDTFRVPHRSRGYYAPEWQKNDLISEKADVYSFGVVLLEIVCCRSNIEVNVSTPDEVLLSTWVYTCFVARELDKLVGGEEVDMRSLERMVKVGLLCIQDDPCLRPSMKNVILMLEGIMDIPILPSTPILESY